MEPAGNALIKQALDAAEEAMRLQNAELEQLRPEIKRLRQAFAEADERADRLHAENGELEQEMADLRNELLVKQELLTRVGVNGKEAFEEAVQRAARERPAGAEDRPAAIATLEFTTFEVCLIVGGLIIAFGVYEFCVRIVPHLA